MHETTIAKSILNIVSTKLKQTANATQALNVHVIIGEFRNVDPVSLEFAFNNLRGFYDGCAICVLEAEVIQAKGLCRKDRHIYHPQFDQGFRCSTCGDGIGELICGEELDVVGIKLEAISNQQENTRKAQIMQTVQDTQEKEEHHAPIGK